MTTGAVNFKKYGIETIEDLFEFCEKIEYGWLDKNGQRHTGVNNNRDYTLQPPEQLLNSKIGICWDQTELHREFLQQNGCHPKTFFLYYCLSDNSCPSHSIATYQQDSKYFWFEPMFGKSSEAHGIHVYGSEMALLKDFFRTWCRISTEFGTLPKNLSTDKFSLYGYTKPAFGINDQKFFDHCRTGKRFNISELVI